MGDICEFKCDKCGYSFDVLLGAEHRFPLIYEKTVKAMKSGEYGTECKEFFEAFPDGAITCENVVAKCCSCGEYFGVLSLDMFVLKDGHTTPKKSKSRIWSNTLPCTDIDYITERELERDYDFFESYDHRCPKCGDNAEIIKDFEKKLWTANPVKLKCPKCREGILSMTYSCHLD